MAYVRLSLMRPMAGHQEEVQSINKELVHMNRRMPGCLDSRSISALDGSGEVGRLTIWASQADADRAANDPRSLTLRSRLHLIILAGHLERSFQAS